MRTIADVGDYRFSTCHVNASIEEVYRTDVQRLVDAAVGGIDGVRMVEVADEKIRDALGQANRSGSPICNIVENYEQYNSPD
ncbi:hypothetical protein Pmar_PMAR024165 [Perkinsus marinus ATCC 50983]|uniref:Uncharacterized protein n=1 Tax=Perkinsus marinus (strain ATCC 50983 / TXsc) TaxID=423536 RepID=C5L2C9_PERM5|nr:hypothetical protein Pmar_PMAR024165 [Perkinsus marinus ATCC 50983]EER09141.1 hypothetical protein Pmar_PMAR024165 [Perkinsus marinus ATCC 50983]|eukprot:XP_002777325.1 hypothetical protein Pmar_PMAR024165 [Perkinsus marinus ATCC 50983]